MIRISTLLTYCLFCQLVHAQEPKHEPEPPAPEPEISLARYTPTVKLIERSLPSVASIQTFKQSGAPGVFNVGVGSGSVIHASGYLLTNDHVISGAADGQVFLPGRQPLRLRTICGMSSEDLALIKVDSGQTFATLPLGRSDDLMLGEPVLVIGNPGGLTHSVSTGIVSGLNRATATETAFLPWMIQTSAAVSGGNSGGPLINALGEQIGVITMKKLDAENINFAISADRVREIFPRMLSAELRYSFRLGVVVDMFKPVAEVSAVADGSPGSKAGVRPGDTIVQIDGSPIRHGIDFHIALIDRKAGDKLQILLKRGDESLSVEAELAPLELAEPVAAENMVTGLRFEAFTGQWEQLPDFDALTPVKSGRADTPTESAFITKDGENYGLRFSGFIKIPTDGLFTFYTSSDDGSRLRIGDEVVVNNDGLHGVMRLGGLTRLKAGMHPITVTFFEAGGAEKLELSYEGPGFNRQTIPAEAYFMQAAERKPAEPKPDEPK